MKADDPGVGGGSLELLAELVEHCASTCDDDTLDEIRDVTDKVSERIQALEAENARLKAQVEEPCPHCEYASKLEAENATLRSQLERAHWLLSAVTYAVDRVEAQERAEQRAEKAEAQLSQIRQQIEAADDFEDVEAAYQALRAVQAVRELLK